ncbi:MAG: bifunctional UDP-sugar hydrolase/5'-nucleotidase [Pseudomonadota bacterium]
MNRRRHILPLAALCITLASCDTAPPPDVEATADTGDTTVTLLFTNDIESVYDPLPAHWLPDIEMIGGIAELATLIKTLRAQEPNAFLFDSGDIFTGSLAKLTQGRLAFELMTTMDYDAMAIGNHEFEYGVEILAWEKNRVAFPVLGANMFYAGTDHPFSQAHAIIERDGIRIGVIGIMGQDAATAIIPSYIAPLDVHDPAPWVQKSVDELRDDVDLIVLLTHQGKTAPMQTDAETDPRLQRDIDAEINLAGAVEGIDVLFSAHADAGTPEAVVHPETGTLIMQTYGQATHLGYLQLTLRDGEVVAHDSRLIPVESNKLEPDLGVVAKLTEYRSQHPDLFAQVGAVDGPLIRRYIEESDMGNVFADIFVAKSGADIAMVHSGGLRKDINAGDVRLVDILDAYPFVDDLQVKEMTGEQIHRALEQSLTFERGIMQLSGLQVTYDLARPKYSRVVSVTRDGNPVADDDRFTVVAAGFLAEGGDNYDVFAEVELLSSHGQAADALIEYFAENDIVVVPERGRQIDLSDGSVGL